MTSRKPREVRQGLEKKGFTMSNRDHKYYMLFVEGKKTGIWTKVTHGSRSEIGDDLLSKMAKQVRLRNNEFIALIDCPMTLDAYLRILRANNHI